MLQTAVHPLQELWKVKVSAALLTAHSPYPKGLDYDAYSSLLLSAASYYDSKQTINKGKRRVYAHDQNHEDDDLYDAL
jgi:hypothetical protein